MPIPPRCDPACDATDLQVALLGRSAYSGSDPVRTHALGMALERQRGVHAIGTDRREDFDTWPGTLAYTPPGMDVFSESPTGGEYLVVRWSGDGVALGRHALAAQRLHWTGHARALDAARHLRRQLLAPTPDPLAIEEATWAFVGGWGQEEPADGAITTAHRSLRALYGRVLDRIASDFAQPLTLAQLAQAEGKTPLRFLREFTQLVGMTPHAFIIETRVQAARAMVLREAGPLASIAFDCGFSHQSHMGVAFRKLLGQTPGQYAARAIRAGAMPAGSRSSVARASRGR